MTKTPHSENTCTKTQPIIHPRNSTNLGIQKSSAFPKISPFETSIRLGVPLSRWSFVLLVKLSGWSTNPSGCSLRFLSLSTSRISRNRIVFQAYSCELFSLNWEIFVFWVSQPSCVPPPGKQVMDCISLAHSSGTRTCKLQRPAVVYWIFGHQNRTFSNSNSVIMKSDIKIPFVFQVESSKFHLVTNQCPKFGPKTRVPFLVMGCFYRSCQGFSLSKCGFLTVILFGSNPSPKKQWKVKKLYGDLLLSASKHEIVLLVTVTGSPVEYKLALSSPKSRWKSGDWSYEKLGKPTTSRDNVW